MKAIFSALILMSLSQAASADELLCASKKDQTLYYTSGQIKVTAEINSESSLSFASLRTTGSTTLGLNGTEEEILGQTKGNYTRFNIGSDAWCDYRLVLPVGFMTKSSLPAFVDAYCEENSNYNIRLYCTVQ